MHLSDCLECLLWRQEQMLPFPTAPVLLTTSLKMRFPSRTPTPCWLTVYVLISFETLKECTSVMSDVCSLLWQGILPVVQVSKMEPMALVGGFRHVPSSLRTWIFCTISNSKTPAAILKTVSVSSCNLMVSSSSLVTMQPFQAPTNTWLTSTHTSCQL